MLGRGELDFVVATHDASAVAGEITRYEPLHWVAFPDYVNDPYERLSLVLFAPGCICRNTALQALEQSDLPWHVACSTRSVALIEQALLASPTLSVMEASTIPISLRIVKPAKRMLNSLQKILLEKRAAAT